MKPILAIAAASLALLAGCEQPTDETAAPGAQDQVAAPEQEQPAPGAPGAVSFSQLDTDGDGNISKTEAQAMPQLEQNFDQADQNQDGMVDQSEFAQFEAGGAPAGQPPAEQPPAGQPSPGMEPAPPAGEQPAPGGTQQQ